MSLLRGITDIFPTIIPETFFSYPKRIKLGFDPTSNFLHLGHSILLRKLQAFQNEGHTPVIIIGDFTARIGDPSGKSTTRKQLTKEEVDANIENFIKTVSGFIDMSRCELFYNSNHLCQLSLSEIINLQSLMTVQQLIAKQDFTNRLEAQTPIGLHEFMYPLLQGYDSFQVKSDVELGGTDQKFNVGLGRDVQKHFGSPVQQVGMLMPILIGTDGTQKMSKSLNNAIGIDEHPISMFSKLEKIPDHLVNDYIMLLTDCELETFSDKPRERQKQMALKVVSGFHGSENAIRAMKDLESLVFANSTDAEVPEVSIENIEFPCRLVNMLKDLNLVNSTSDARRKIKNGSVRLNGIKVTDENHIVDSSVAQQIVQLSKKEFFKLV
jgi:tyrosyl-tRNA synthetase